MLKPFLLCVLGFSLCGVSGEAYNSTQMYYVRLTVDESAVANVSEALLDKSYGSVNYSLNSLKKTTECDLSTPGVKSCRCVEGFEWSAAACRYNSECCETETCEDNKFPCLPNTSVSFTGSLTLKDLRYHDCLDEKNSADYKECNTNLITTIQKAYSKIYGFDSLKITDYLTGSVIAKFEVVVASKMNPLVLQETSKELTAELGATLSLETTGVVRMKVPPGRVKFKTSTTVSCCSDTDLKSRPYWELKNYLNETKDIHNGRECTIISGPLTSSIHLTSVSQLWKGRYTCNFEQKQNNVNINHKASADMDVCVLPKVIITSTSPGFPRCVSSNTDLQPITVFCEVEQTYEEYNITWTKENIAAKIISEEINNNLGMTVFSAQTFVTCNSVNPKVTCSLKNRCGQDKREDINIIAIKVDDKFCKAEGDWGNAKAGETAVIRCKGSVGQRTRLCNGDGQWGTETSFCVNHVLQRVLSNAEISDVGVGKLETNANKVFTQLQSVTNNTKAINSVANLETSVNVIDMMDGKLIQLDNETTVDEFLGSSSNLLDKTLNRSWTSASNTNGSQILAEKYLSSVEELIGKAEIKNQTKKTTKPNLDVASCNTTQKSCQSTVFNNTVTIESEGAFAIKTAGFLELEHYLPNHDSSDEPNSIIVSTTKNRTGRVKIHIDFQLMRPRPRNTELKCVFWDMNEHKWSEKGCKWITLQSLKKEACECDHLSAFAIFMSKQPLEVPYLSKITYVGLSVSIACLIMFLVIELIIWSDVVKTDTLHLRHCAHVNILICLLVGDICFLASHLPGEISDIWCKTFVVVEHFCFLAMFFWMLCLSCILLHKTVYLSLHKISKTAYLRFSIILGYICPLLIVAITFLANNGEEGRYYTKETRWLVYNGTFKGSIFTFILPIGIIVFVNLFFMFLVIMRLLQPVEASQWKDKKDSAKTVIRSVILLTPVFGLTWGFGFGVLVVDLTQGPSAYAVHYIFSIMNAFQGLYIFLTTCMGDRMVREALRRRFRKKTSDVRTVSSSSNDTLKEN